MVEEVDVPESCRTRLGKLSCRSVPVSYRLTLRPLPLQQPKRRIPRANATPIEITKPRQWNNGSIEIIQAEIGPPPAPQAQDKLNVDEVLINGRRYRVPERIITLDFWDKVARNRRGDSASER